MDRARIVRQGIGVLIVIGGIVLLYLGGCGAKGKSGQQAASKPTPDPLGGWFGEYRSCADGTFYMTTGCDKVSGGGKVFWLVAGKATPVECPEPIHSYYQAHSDAKGGLYVAGEEHLWYFYKGAAAQVKEVPRNQIPEGEHRVTTRSVNWSVLQSYGRGAYEAGEEAARDPSGTGE